MPETRWRLRAAVTLAAAVAVSATLSMGGSPARAVGKAGLLAVVDGTVVEYKAAKGKQSGITLTRTGNTITVDDRVAIKVGAGCRRVKGDKTRARCTPAAAPTRVRVYAYDRNDTITNNTDLPVTADGGTGSDKLTGGPGHDRLYGRSGNDVLKGRGGNDALYGEAGNDKLYGSAGDDALDDGPGTDVAWGGTGSDGFTNGTGNDRFYGEAGDDYYNSRQHAGRDADRYLGGPGVDSAGYTHYKSAVSLDLDGRKGDDGRKGEGDTIGADVENLLGGLGKDRLVGNGKANYLDGREGNDTLRGGGGNDTLLGRQGADKLYGDAGNDMMLGHEGVDKMYGGAGDDWLDGNYIPGVYEDYDEVTDWLDGGTNTAVGDTCVRLDLRYTTTGCENH
ncbi:calcium-binding protein [Actinoplanes sp. NPDC049668]|uniref:calcium-binding protein n=1 Tax=unclassified Actinoplanes TaxID=2626549 RepID=UPI0033A98597